MRLVHGWLLDEQDEATTKVVGKLSYNHLVECIIKMRDVEDQREKLTAHGKEETPEQKEANDKIIHEGVVIDNFLQASAGQLTYHGLQKLHEDVRELELCVLFRNNHFSTLFKNQGELYSLVTDVGYMNEAVVWEKLCEIDGDNIFVNSDFVIPRPKPPAEAREVSEQEAADRLMALQLMQEDQMAAEAAAAQQQQQYATQQQLAAEQQYASQQQQQQQHTQPARQQQQQPQSNRQLAQQAQQQRQQAAQQQQQYIAQQQARHAAMQQQQQQQAGQRPPPGADDMQVTDEQRRQQQLILEQIQRANSRGAQQAPAQQQPPKPQAKQPGQRPKTPIPGRLGYSANSPHANVPLQQKQKKEKTCAIM